MKHLKKRILPFFLALLMLVSLLLPLGAEEEIVNYYDASLALPGIPDVKNINGAFIAHGDFCGSNIIEVSEGDKVYFAPANPNQAWTIAAYKSETNGYSITPKQVETHATFANGSVVLCWTVPAGVTMMRMAQNVQWMQSTVITKNQPINESIYNELIKKEYQESSIKENLFKVAAPGIPSDANLETAMMTSKEYYTSSPMAVTAGNVLYLAPVDINTDFWVMTAYDTNGHGLSKKITLNSLEQHQALTGNSYIMKYTVPSNVAYVCMVTPNKYARNTVVTKNAPFTSKDYNAYVASIDVDASIPKHENSVLKGKTALFIGDSINAGSYDVMSPTAGRAIAGRIATSTGLKITNKSVGGATLIQNSEKSWIVDQLNSQKGQKFDLIVIFGGVNDVRRNTPPGTVPTTPSNRVNSFAGGLQYLISVAQENHPNAEIVYISCFPLPGHHVGSADDMTEYAAIAGDVCEERGIHFLDLYNHEELVAKLRPKTVRYLPDLLHPTSEGYDLITPYIQAELERIMGGTPMGEETTAPEVTETEATSATGEQTNDATTAVSTSPSTQAPTLGEEPQKKGCGSTVCGGIALVTLVSLAALPMLKKKEN